MSKKMALLCALIAAAMLLLTGCAGTKPATVSGDWEIGLSLLTDSPTFYTRNQDGTTMGVIAMLGADGQPRLAYDTCQVCMGSPYAYFDLHDGALVCENCGNTFDYSTVGADAGGCNPLPVGEYSVTENSITIPASELAANAAFFANWKKGA